MGKMLESLIEAADDVEVVGIVDVDNVDDLKADPPADVVIDFSGPGIFPELSGYISRTGTALVSGSTGYADQGQALKDLGKFAPVIYTENYSVGVNVMAQVTAELSRLLGDEFDVELVEAHHRFKKDSPSGTAQLLLRAVDPEGERTLVYGRDPSDGARSAGDIGVHSIRGGTVPGDHTVGFYGEDEQVTISHRASSRRIFAQGALTMARRLVGQEPGSYTFAQLLAQS